MNHNIEHIFKKYPHSLVTRFNHLGDVILTTGVLNYWGETYKARFSVLTKNSWKSLFDNHPYVDNVYTLPDEDLSFIKLIKYFKTIANNNKNSALIDFHGSIRSFILKKLWHEQVFSYPKMHKERKQFLKSKDPNISKMLSSLTIPQRYSLALEVNPPPSNLLVPKIWLTENEKTYAKNFLKPNLLGNIVAIHPFATHMQKTWQANKWINFIKELDNNNIPWIIIGKGSPLFKNNDMDITNKTSLRQTASILKYCKTLITGDSGPMHLATAVGTPVIALFGPTTKEWGFYPVGSKDQVLELPLNCRPCSLHGKNSNCEGMCINKITFKQVMDAIANI